MDEREEEGKLMCNRRHGILVKYFKKIERLREKWLQTNEINQYETILY